MTIADKVTNKEIIGKEHAYVHNYPVGSGFDF